MRLGCGDLSELHKRTLSSRRVCAATHDLCQGYVDGIARLLQQGTQRVRLEDVGISGQLVYDSE